MLNGETKGGIHVYTEVYKWFTETSGLRLAEQARKLMHPDPIKREEELADRIEDWVQKVDRLSRHGGDYEMAPAFKVAALQHMLSGEPRRMYQNWKLENISFDKMLAKLKEYARGQKLDSEANRGKQAVDINRAEPARGDGEEEDEDAEGGLNKLSNVKCTYCKKKGHCSTMLEGKRG